MYLTLENLKAIEDYLKRKSIKDTDLNSIYELDPEDIIIIIHNHTNYKISVRDLYKGFGKNNIINYNEYVGDYNSSFSLSEVISNIKTTNRIPGSIITFIDSSSNQWETYQFNSSTVDNWLNIEYWRNLYENTNNKFKGFFTNEILLYNECPIPYVGDYAYVGNTLGEALVYVCRERGNWAKTSEMIISNSAVLLK